MMKGIPGAAGVDANGVADTRERLVRAAIDVFLEKGYGGTRVQDIARRAGFTSGALYVHFPSRTALLGEAILREGDAILTSMAETLRRAGGGDRMVAAMLADLTDGAPTDLDRLLLEALALATRDSDARAALAVPLQGFVDALQARVTLAQSQDRVDPALSPAAVAHVLLSFVFGAVMTNALDLTEASPAEIATVNSRLLEGLRAES